MRIAPLLLAISAAFAQTPEPAPKPLRERLLERALRGDTEAQFDLAKNYETGRIGLRRDFAQARHWYLEAANRGDPYAQASLAILFSFGKGVPVDYVQACMWYELAIAGAGESDRESIEEKRASIARRMTPEQLAESRRLAREWKPAPK